MFSVYTPIIIKYILLNKPVTVTKDVQVTYPYIFVSLLFPVLFVLSLGSAIIMKGLNIGFTDFEQFKIMLGILQTGFGAYMGITLSTMFVTRNKKI
jgi:hypothetical protein